MKNSILIVSVVAVLPLFECAGAEKLPSAAQALKGVLSGVEKTKETKNALSHEGVYRNLQKIENLPSDEQAKQWVAQVVALGKITERSENYWEYSQLIMKMLLKSFPEVEAWPAFSKELMHASKAAELSADSSKALQLLSKLLEGDRESFKSVLYNKSLEKKKKSILSQLLRSGGRERDPFSSVKSNYEKEFADVDFILERFKKNLSTAKKQLESGGYVNLIIPSLVSDYGEDEAKELLKSVVEMMVLEKGESGNRVHFDFPKDKATLELIASLLKENKSAITVYPSRLMRALRDIDLLNRMLATKEKFSKRDQKEILRMDFDLKVCSGDLEGAKQALLALEQAHAREVQPSVGKLPQMDPGLLGLLMNKLHSDRISISPKSVGEKEVAFGTLLKLVKETNRGELWELVNGYGLELGKSDEVLALFSQKFPEVTPSTIQEAQAAVSVAETYLSLGAVKKGRQLRESAIGIYEKELAVLQKEHPDVGVESFPLSTLARLYKKEANVARVLGEKEIAKAWNLKMLNMPSKLGLDESGGFTSSGIEYELLGSASELIEMNYLAEAQQVLVGLLELYKVSEGAKKTRRSYYSHSYYGSSNRAQVGEKLVKLYRAADRAEDIIWLLKHYPYWEKKDLFEMDDQELLVNVAWALNETGEGELAFSLLQNGMLEGFLLNYDPAYRTLLSLKNPKTASLIDELIAGNLFQERPVIWKAQLALERKDFVTAEKLARQGIAIDPSDGEQGKDDRMQVYAVLADALAGQAKKKDAKLFREVVAAIRMGEEADSLFYAGLTKLALEKYNRSLERFADAYCLQSRLAVFHAKMGENKKAEYHYQRAFELMPSSFGRIESHCFGCEGAFSGEVAQGIAERVFRKLIKEDPKHPQTYYLMGYLEDSRERPSEALEYYRQAVQLDPLYLNAWSKIASSEVKPTAEYLKLKEEATMQLLKLDPTSKESSRKSNMSFQLKKAYGVLQAAQKITKMEKATYPLTASAKRVQTQEESQANENSFIQSDLKELERALGDKKNPRSILWRDRIINDLLRVYWSSAMQ